MKPLSSFLSYRRDIDGLRAVAVLLVIIFHIYPSAFPGGFLGVDIFFVISGYVITVAIYKQLEKKSFSLLDFYVRRFNRLYPSLILVVASTVIALIIFSPYSAELGHFFTSGMMSIVALSNIYFLFSQNDYFLSESTNPFTHTWSLGIEEQFYILYPFLIFIIAIFGGRKHFLSFGLKIIAPLILISFTIATFFLDTTIGNYFSPLARAWELLAGCLLCLVSLKYRPHLSHSRATIFFIAGWLLIVVSVILFQVTSYNAPMLVPAILGTMLIIASGWTDSTQKFRRILTHPIALYIGKLSYVIYLWHIPVIFFAEVLGDPASIVYPIIIVITTLVLSIATHHVVESPFRHGAISINDMAGRFRGVVVMIFFIPVILFAASTLSPQAGDQRYQAKVLTDIYTIAERKNTFFNSDNTNFSLRYWYDEEYGGMQKSCIGSGKNPTPFTEGNCVVSSESSNMELFLIGDSKTAHHIPTVIAMKDISSNIYLQAIGGCYILSDDYNTLVETRPYLNAGYNDEQLRTCNTFAKDIFKKIINFESPHKKIILTTLRGGFVDNGNRAVFEQDQREVFSQLEDAGIEIIILLDTPDPNEKSQNCLLYSQRAKCDYLREDARAYRIQDTDLVTTVAADYDNVHIWDPFDLMCDSDICNNFSQDFAWFSSGSHITVEAGEFLSKDLERFMKKNTRLINQ